MSYEVSGSLSLSDKNVFRVFEKNYFFFLVNLLTAILSKAHKLGKEWANVIDADSAHAFAAHVVGCLKKKITDRKLVAVTASSDHAINNFDASCSLLLHQAADEFSIAVFLVAGLSSRGTTSAKASGFEDTVQGSGESDNSEDNTADEPGGADTQNTGLLPRKTEAELLSLTAKALTQYKKDLASNTVYVPASASPAPSAKTKTAATTVGVLSSAAKDAALATKGAAILIIMVTKVVMGHFGLAATMEEATRLSADNVRRALGATIDVKAIETNAHFAFHSRRSDFFLVPYHDAKSFGSYFVDVLSPKLRDCIRLHDDTAALSGGPRFSVLLSSAATADAAIAQLQTWASKLRRDKHELAAAVAAITPPTFVAALPSSSGPAAVSADRRWGCHHCSSRGLPGAADHTREDCVAGYRCAGCGKVGKPNSPVGHTWRSCPNPTVGGVCPPHRRP